MAFRGKVDMFTGVKPLQQLANLQGNASEQGRDPVPEKNAGRLAPASDLLQDSCVEESMKAVGGRSSTLAGRRLV